MDFEILLFTGLFSIPLFYLAYLQVFRPEEYYRHREKHDGDVKKVFGTAAKVAAPFLSMWLGGKRWK